MRRLPRCPSASTSVEYALLAALVALVIAPALTGVAIRLDSIYLTLRFALSLARP